MIAKRFAALNGDAARPGGPDPTGTARCLIAESAVVPCGTRLDDAAIGVLNQDPASGVFLPVVGVAHVVVELAAGDDEPLVGIAVCLLVPAACDQDSVELVRVQIAAVDPDVFEAALALVGGVTAHEDPAAGRGPKRAGPLDRRRRFTAERAVLRRC